MRQSSIQRRPGVVLLVVITMLALFASLALSFVFYAEAESNAAQAARAAFTASQADVDPELLLSYALSQIIYDTNNVYSAVRGHSLVRSLYGYNPANISGAFTANAINTTPFNGMGRPDYTTVLGVNNKYLVNYQDYSANPADNKFAHDPEIFGARGTGSFFVGANAPYTYPDTNNMFLAAVNADGEVLMPSYHRDWIGKAAQTHPNLSYNVWADTTSAAAKYYVLRPHPSYHSSFPLPEDGHADVRNLEYSKGWKQTTAAGTVIHGNNDSFWLDLGFGTMTAPNGKKYRPLFAPLIIDLDNRVHLWVSGNKNHKSNQGFGPPELNLNTVLQTNAATEVPNLLNLRFGGNDASNNAYPPLVGLPAPNAISPAVDFDAITTGPYIMPGITSGTATFNGRFDVTPAFPADWANGTGVELTNNNHAFTYPNPTNKDNPNLPAAQMEPLLRFMGTNSPGITSKLMTNLPGNFATPSSHARGLTTLLSWHFDRPLGSPYLWFDPSAKTPAANVPLYQLAATNAYPKQVLGMGVPSFPSYGSLANQINGEFLPNRANSALVQRLRTNLTSPSLASLQDRQNLAADIFHQLVHVTGAMDPKQVAANGGTVDATTTQYAASRWLAQLAVNIVDYIDSDNDMTPFNWYGTDYVVGTELPRLVLNEAYVSLDNVPTDLKPGTDAGVIGNWTLSNFKLNFWVELLNPLKTGTESLINGADPKNPVPIYQIVLCPSDTTFANASNSIGAPAAPMDPNGNKVMNDWQAVQAATNKANTVTTVNPVNGAVSEPVGAIKNNGFFVVGNNATFVTKDKDGNTRDPKLPYTFQSAEMSVTIPKTQLALANPSILLQRLAVPSLPVQSDATKANYNPYVTIDFIKNIKFNDNRVVALDAAGNPAVNAGLQAITSFVSYGRKQPYAALMDIVPNPAKTAPPGSTIISANSQIVAQATVDPSKNPQNGGNKNVPIHTFFQQNLVDVTKPTNTTANPPANITLPFDWLVHLDRPLINELELLHVSSYRPCDLTQKFVSITGTPATTTKFMHYAPWLDQTALIYRVLDQLGGPSRLNGLYAGGREPGRININTLFPPSTGGTPEQFTALCDPQAGISSFTATQVNNIWTNLQGSRTPGTNAMLGAGTYQNPPVFDRPFQSFTAGYVAANDTNYHNATGTLSVAGVEPGIQDTLLRKNAGGSTLFRLQATDIADKTKQNHPYVQWELLQKIANNITTTSNVFGVWLTVGFFEVVDDSVLPVKLGAEIGRSDNRHIRHRFFAIVDRSEIALCRGVSGTYTAPTMGTVSATNPGTITLTGAPTSVFFNPGDSVMLELTQTPVTKSIFATCQSIVGTTWTFTVSSAAPFTPFTATLRGNPGPQTRYNPRNDRLVVPHFTVIE